MKKWLLCLDLTITDYSIIRSAIQFAQIVKPEQVTLLHVYREEKIPATLMNELMDLSKMDMEQIKSKMKDREQLLIESGLNYDTQVIKGQVLPEILRYARKSKADMLITHRSSHSGNLDLKLVRKSPCCVMVAKEHIAPRFDDIFVPVDFSDHTEAIFDSCKPLLDKASRVRIFHAMTEAGHYLRSTYHTVDEVNKSLNKRSLLNNKIEEHADFKLNECVSRLDVNETEIITSKQLIYDNEETADVIINKILDSENNLVVIGSKGNNASIASLLGSVAEAVCRSGLKVPILVIKKKNENKGFLNALLAIRK